MHVRRRTIGKPRAEVSDAKSRILFGVLYVNPVGNNSGSFRHCATANMNMCLISIARRKLRLRCVPAAISDVISMFDEAF
eukprot:2210044-Pleurochrysis_carterae.AAC.1